MRSAFVLLILQQQHFFFHLCEGCQATKLHKKIFLYYLNYARIMQFGDQCKYLLLSSLLHKYGYDVLLFFFYLYSLLAEAFTVN